MHQLWTSATGADYHNFSAIFTHDDIEVRTRDLIVRGYVLDFREIFALILFTHLHFTYSLLFFPVVLCCHFLSFPAVNSYYFPLCCAIIFPLITIISYYYPLLPIFSYYFLLFPAVLYFSGLGYNAEEH